MQMNLCAKGKTTFRRRKRPQGYPRGKAADGRSWRRIKREELVYLQEISNKAFLRSMRSVFVSRLNLHWKITWKRTGD